MQQDPLSDINLTPRVFDGSNPYLVEAQRQANEIRQPGIGGSTANAGSAQNPYLTFLQQPAEAPSQSPAIASIAGTMSINPDQAAQASRLGKEFGLGQDIALRNMEELRRRSLIYSLERNGTMNRNPVLAQWMMNPANAAMAHDDISSLSRLEKIEEYLYALPEEFGAGFSTGQIQVATGKIGSNAMVRGLPTSEEWQAWNAYQSELQTLSGDVGFWRQTGELVGQMASTGKDVLEAATVGALYGGTVAAVGGQLGPQVVIPEEILTVPAGMIIGAKAGAVGALFTSSARTMAGNNYMKNLEIGRDPDISRFTALGVGVIGGALETYGTKLVAKPLGGLWSRLVSEAANEAIVKPTVGKAMAKAGIEWLKATGGEIGTETAQQITEIALDEVNGFASDPAFESRFATADGRRGIKNELVDVFVRTAMGVSVVGSIGPGANLLIDTRRASRAKNSQRVIAETVAAIDATKLKARNPDALEEYADNALDETQAYIRGSTLRQLLTDAKVSDADLDAIVPGLSARVREAETAGNFVSMPLAQFGVRFGGTPLGDAMVPHLTIDPRAMTPTELAAFERERQELTAEAEKLLEAKTATDEAFVQEADEIHASVKQRLVTAGRDELAADAEATIYQAMIVTAAAREGMTPQQYADQYGLREIVGEGQAAQEQALEQAVTPAPESGVFDVNNPPTAKPGMRDVSQGPAIVALMDYDGTVYYDVNATMHGDLIDTFPEIADTVIDGGFIIDGKYVMNASDGGYAAEEGGSERMAEVRRFTKQVNTRKQRPLEQAARTTRNLGPIEAAKAIVQETGREAFTDADEFFKKRWDALLKKTKRQVKPSPRNFREAAKRAVADILDFVKNNPKFADYYANDWKATRSILDDYIGRAITDDEFAMFRTIAGLTSPNTMLPANISDTVGLWDHWMREGNFDAFTLGPKPGTGALVVFEAAEPISGTTANVKVRTIRIIERLIKERGGVTQALEYLQEGVPVKELHKFNRKMGYSGAVGDIGNITDLVQQATGQSKLIPRMFIFGQKVGAYTLNAIGDERYTTVDIWESRYIRSHFTGMFDVNIGLPESTDEHQIFTRFGDLFKEEMEAVTGRKWAPSALQALRWFYIIGSAREAGYSKASTNETISFYTERRLVQAFGYPGRAATSGGPSVGTAALGGAAGQVRAARIPPKRFERNLETDVAKLDNPDQRRRAIAAGYVRYARYNSELGQRGFSFDERRGGPARQHGILNATIAADFVPGERLQSAFGKANLPLQTMQELVADADGAQAFRSLVAATNASNPYGAAVAVYTAEEYQGKRLFVTEDATAGFALSADGDIVSVFSAPKSGNGRAVMALSVQVGGRRLDCFDTALPGYYAAHGFRAVARLAWNDEYAPTGWNKDTFKTFNDGRPDVVFMVYERGYNGEYKAGDGATVGDYDAGLQAQARALQAIAKSQQFQQAARGQARGGFDPQRMRMFLTSKQDASTTIHELMHLALQSMTDLARSGNASPQVLADLDLLFQWRKEAIAGDTPQERLATWLAMPIDQQRTALQEPLAYNGEIYIFEGKAPTEKLQPVFDRLRAFMLRVYKSIRDEINAIYRQQFGEDLPMLTPEVRGVFDRILASDNQIRQQAAVNEMRPQFQTQEQSGMDDATWAAYQEMQQEAMDASITDLSKASLRQMQWLSGARAKVLRDMQEKHAALRREVTVEMAAAVRVDKVYRALTFLRYGKFIDEDGQEVEIDGPHKLDLETVKQMYELEPEALRPDVTAMARGKYGFVGTDGLDPDIVAEMFGYTSGDQMIRAVLAAKPIKEEIKARTDAEMTRRYGDMNTRQAQEAEVQKALHNEARARMVAVELRWAAKMQQPVRVLMDAARSAAQRVIGRKRIRDLRPSEFVTAETQAAREATGLMQMRDPSVAAQAAATKAYNEAVAAGRTVDEATAESMAAGVAAADKARTQLAEFDARYPGMTREQRIYTAKRHQLLNNQMARAALEAREQVDKDVKYLRRVLRDKSVERMGADAADQIAQLLERFEVAAVSLKRLDERKNLAQYMAEMEEQGLVPNIAPKLIAETNRVNYREMTVDQFNDLVEAVKQIEYIGKNARKLQLANERVAFNDKRDEIVTRIRATGRLRGLDLDPRSPLTNIGRTIARLQSFAAAHLKAASVAFILDGGKEDGPLWNTVIRTANDAADMETRMRSEATAKLAEILKPVFALGRMGGKGKFFQSVNRSLNREAVIAIALNMGNAGNMQRLLDGEGWTMDQVQPILQSLTAAEWNAVQQVWDYLETYRPLIAAKERRLYGKEPNWVEPQPLTVQTADGQSLTLRGGYYPVKYDPVASDRVAMVDEVQEAKDALRGTYTAATTRRSFTKDRAEKVVGRPILYTLDAAFSGVNDVIHDLAWHEWLISTNRLLRDETFANAVRETRGPEFLRQLREWAKSNAAGDRPANVEGVLSWLRQGISASGLGFNVMSAALQITGFNQSVVRVGAKWVGLGIAEFTASPFATSQFVRDNSMFMAERQRTQFRELNELRNTVRGKSGVRRVLAQAYVAMMTMQRAVDTPTWVGAYRKALAGGKDHATAVALADQAVKDSQGSGLTSDLAAIERGGPGLKLFTVFYGYMNTVYNMAAMQTYTARGRGKLAADYVLLLVVPVVLSHAIKAALTPDTGDDEFDPEALARKLAAEELSYLMGTMVVVREFGGAAEIVAGAEGVRMGYGGPAGVRAIGEAYNLATQTQQGEFDRAWFRSAINTLGAFTGLPSAQINRTIDGVEAILEDEVEGVEAVVAPVTGVKR